MRFSATSNAQKRVISPHVLPESTLNKRSMSPRIDPGAQAMAEIKACALAAAARAWVEPGSSLNIVHLLMLTQFEVAE